MLDDIRAMIRDRRYVITFHAIRRMEERGVSKADVITLIMNGDIIEEYPDSGNRIDPGHLQLWTGKAAQGYY